MTVSTIYRSLWRHRLFIILMTALLAAVAFFVSSSQTKLYTATALVRVQQKVTNANDVFGSLQTGERLAQTYAEIARRIRSRARFAGSSRRPSPTTRSTSTPPRSAASS